MTAELVAAKATHNEESRLATLAAFLMTTVDGFVEGPNGAFDFWAVDNDEFERFSVDQLDRAGTLVFGRVTFQGMASYWQTDAARSDSPDIAARMNALPKVVVSRTLEWAQWRPTTIVDSVAGLGSIATEPDRDLLVLGSSRLVAALAEHRLLDELRIMVNPVAIGRGRPALASLPEYVRLHLRDVRQFASGSVLLTYGVKD